MDDVIARVRARAEAAKADRETTRERMRREYPKHAALVDAFRAAGINPASVTVDGVTFGKRTPDPERPPILRVSEFMRGLESGAIQPSGQVRERRKW